MSQTWACRLRVAASLVLLITGLLLNEYRNVLEGNERLYSNHLPDDMGHAPIPGEASWPEKSCRGKVEGNLTASHNHRFQEVQRNVIYAVSAYEDRRDLQVPEVKVISLVPSSSRNTSLQCLHYDDFGCLITQKPARFTIFQEGLPAFCRWKSAIIHCPLPSSTTPASLSISNSKDIDHPASNHLHINRNTLNDTHPSQRLGLCLYPLFGMGDERLSELIEFLELHKMFLLDKVFVYSPYNVSERILKALHVYEDSGFVEIVPWHLPVPSDNSGAGSANKLTAKDLRGMDRTGSNNPCVKKFAQVAVYNDCIYRTMSSYKYIALYDIDEFIVPRSRRTWPEMFEEIELRIKGKAYASYKVHGLDFCGPFVADPYTGIRRRATAYGRNDIFRHGAGDGNNKTN